MPRFHYDRSRGSFKSWLRVVTRSRIHVYFRREKSREELVRDPVPHDPGGDEALDPCSDRAAEKFQILSCASCNGVFNALNLPLGLSVNYSSNGVFLAVTGPVVVPATLQTPQIPSGDFSFNFQTASDQSYTIQQNTNLATTNWLFITNFTGDGSIWQFAAPVPNGPQNYFRVRQP